MALPKVKTTTIVLLVSFQYLAIKREISVEKKIELPFQLLTSFHGNFASFGYRGYCEPTVYRSSTVPLAAASEFAGIVTLLVAVVSGGMLLLDHLEYFHDECTRVLAMIAVSGGRKLWKQVSLSLIVRQLYHPLLGLSNKPW